MESLQASTQIETPTTPVTTIQVQPTFSWARVYSDIASNAFGVVLGLAIGGMVLWKIIEYIDLKGFSRSLLDKMSTSYSVIQSNSEIIKKHSDLIEKQQATLAAATEALHRVEDMIDELRDGLERSGNLSQYYPPNKKPPKA